MRFFNKVFKIAIFTILVFSSLPILWCIWWYAPVSVKASAIEKMNVQGIYEDQVKDCEWFAMTPNEFRAYWKDVRPIFDVETHEYSYGSCYFKTVEDGKEYKVYIGGIGEITKDDTTYYYVRKGDKPDIPDMPPVKTTLMQDIQTFMYLVEYIFRYGIN